MIFQNPDTTQLTYEINTNCGNIRLRIGVIGETKQQTRFTHARIANQEELEQKVAVKQSGGRMERIVRMRKS